MGTEQAVLDYVRAKAPRNDPEAILAAVDQFGRGGHWMMNLGHRKGQVLAAALDAVGAQRVLELGSYFGYSAILMASRMGAEGELITVDADRSRHEVSREMVEYAGLADRVRLVRGRAETVIPTLKGKFDLVFIDHYGEHYLPDLELIEAHRLLRPGAAVVADNVVAHRPTVDGYLDHVRNGGNYRSTLHKVGGDGVEVSIWNGG
jgi:catechol O-methyltransferase